MHAAGVRDGGRQMAPNVGRVRCVWFADYPATIDRMWTNACDGTLRDASPAAITFDQRWWVASAFQHAVSGTWSSDRPDVSQRWRFNATQRNTETAQHNTAQHNTIQYTTVYGSYVVLGDSFVRRGSNCVNSRCEKKMLSCLLNVLMYWQYWIEQYFECTCTDSIGSIGIEQSFECTCTDSIDWACY